MNRTILLVLVGLALALLIVNGFIPWWVLFVALIAYIVADQV